MGEHAVRAAAVRHHLTVGGDLVQAGLQLLDRDVDGTGQVSGGVLQLRAHVHQGQLVRVHAPHQLLAVHGGDGRVVAEVGVTGRAHVGQPGGGEFAGTDQEVQHIGAGDAVEDPRAVAAGGHYPCLLEGLQMR